MSASSEGNSEGLGSTGVTNAGAGRGDSDPLSSPFSGSLAADARGLWQRLSRLYSAATLQRLDSAYRKAASSPLVAESHLKRTKGASFSPRPARLASLALQFRADPSEDLLLMALSCPFDGRAGLCGPELCAELPSSTSAPEIANAQNEALVAGIDLLDRVRHLHLTEEAQPRRQSLWEGYQSLEKASLPPGLRTLIDASFERYDRHHGGAPSDS
jgi:hypothetical protein